VRVFAEYGNYMTEWAPFMDNGKALVRFKDGTIGSMDVCFSTEWPYPHTVVELMGREGSLILRLTEANWTECTIYKESGLTTHRGSQEDAIAGEMKSWVRACLDKTEPEMSAEEAMKVLELCIGWKESAKTGQPVCLPLKE